MAQAVSDKASMDLAADIDVIKEQTRETVAILRQLVEMLLPKGDPDAARQETVISRMRRGSATLTTRLATR